MERKEESMKRWRCGGDKYIVSRPFITYTDTANVNTDNKQLATDTRPE